MSDHLFKKGDTAVLIILSAPNLNAQLVSIKVMNKEVTKAGEKQFSFGNRNHKQSDVGTIVSGITYSSYTIIVPKGKDEDKYIKMAYDHVHALADKLRKKCAFIIEKTDEGLAKLDINNIERD